MKKKFQLIFLALINIFLIALILFYPHYAKAAAEDKSIGFCFFKNYLRIYCVTCGGTRAFGDMLSFDLISAVKHNALVFLGFAYIIFLDLYAIFAFFKKKDSLIYFKPIFCLYAILFIFLFVLIRNLLLYAFGIDPIGDILR